MMIVISAKINNDLLGWSYWILLFASLFEDNYYNHKYLILKMCSLSATVRHYCLIKSPNHWTDKWFVNTQCLPIVGPLMVYWTWVKGHPARLYVLQIVIGLRIGKKFIFSQKVLNFVPNETKAVIYWMKAQLIWSNIEYNFFDQGLKFCRVAYTI